MDAILDCYAKSRGREAIGRMGSALSAEEETLLDRALHAARDTRWLAVARDARHDTARVFASAFGDGPAVIVADDRTFAAAGTDVRESFRRAGVACEETFLFGPDVSAAHSFVEMLQDALGSTRATPVAVGSGTINDLTKLVAHRLGRPYMAVATAASMDGYTAYGASITHRGSKQTFDCPAPRAVVADLDVIAHAPRQMNAAGYADLLAKGVAGADWIVADAAGAEPIDPATWATVQGFLPSWVDAPGGIARAEPGCLRRLVVGLMMSGFAMQAARTSRPASGAEHQFSHLWDMQHHTHEGAAPSHGFKVGIGTLASLALYDVLLRRDLQRLDVDAAVAGWPAPERVEARIAALLGSGDLAEKATEEARAKDLTPDALHAQLVRLRDGWPALRERLARHLLPFWHARAMLREAGCPSEPEQIGISRDRLRRSYEQAYYLRRRFTVLDLAMRLGVFHSALGELFGPGGAWSPEGGRS
jgi:glycerol-1-phosphate dehydrogenase [NAD(P)+]